MSVDPLVVIGPFVVGEKPAPLEYQFQDNTGAPINLTGYDARFSCIERGGATVTADGETASVTDDVGGKVTYVWQGIEFPTPGRYEAELWVGNGNQRFASVLIAFTVRSAVASTPNI